MRDYIIQNGIDSRTISGLLIQALPPISKPKMRAEIEEIDGRSGDIITELGYSAYDREIVIGLYNNFDIDEIIKYFNSKGTIIFSNEEDKIYNYTVLEAIDFEKLLRFRTATVKYHVQPFKYSAIDNSKTFQIDDISEIEIRNSGNIYSRPVITIEGSGNINLYLNDIQIFSIALGSLESITIDTNNMEAYNGSVLLNRIVTGNYDNFKLNIGLNTISWTGDVSEIEISNYSRWI